MRRALLLIAGTATAAVAIAALVIALIVLSRDTAQDPQARRNVQRLQSQLATARSHITYLETRADSLADDLETNRDYQLAIELFCEGFRSTRRYSEDEYAVVITHALIQACDYARIPTAP